ncbi:MAG TPA: T9SS type A sorting domain-containing protein [Flavobacteriales bacterium]|nr:T9SS type A sorting domain-containing protein [Flavobacteriales bacterium]
MRKFLPYLIILLPIPLSAQMTNNGNIQFHSGASVAVKGDFTNNGTLTDDGTMVYFNGAACQTVGGTSVITFKNITLNNTAGLTLQNSITVSNSLALTSGLMSLGSNTLTISNSATTAITRTTGCIVSEQTNNTGKIKWNMGTTTGAHIFPFSNAAGTYIPFILDLTSGNIGAVTVSTYPTAANNTPYPVTPTAVTHVNDAFGVDNSGNTVNRFWQIDKDGAGGVATLTFNATPAEVGTLLSLQAQRWNDVTAGWDLPITGQTSLAYGAVVPGVTTFSPWTLSGNLSTLPIQLLAFNVALNDNEEVDLAWTTLSEINNDYFTIEKTVDLENFETVAVLEAAGSTNQTKHYYSKDVTPFAGISYYRLKQTDFDGNSSYSDLVAVELKKSGTALSVYPNPATDVFTVLVTANNDAVIAVKVFDASGKCVFVQDAALEDNQARMRIEANLAKGIYTVVAEGKDFREQGKLVVN